MPANISRLIATFPERVRKQAEQNGKEVEAFLEAKLKDRLSRPYPPASQPGEAPALRSGRLQRETYCKSEVIGDSVVITMASPTPYAGYLVNIHRLWITTVKEENRAQVEQMLLRKGYNNLTRWFRG
jgi:hypothetical protein